MTMTTYNALVCECGHRGRLGCRENDAPFSGLWEAYTLDGFEGHALTITSYKDLPEDPLAAVKPRCPSCGQTGKVTFAPKA